MNFDLIRNLQENASNSEKLTPLEMDEIQRNIRQGAKDPDQNWKDALELTNKAYSVVGHEIPTPNEKEKWKQYEENLNHSVNMLSKYRGGDADWRITQSTL